jgi:hypothetical protein
MDVADLLTKVSDNLSVRRAFGSAYEKDGMLIIPVAMVAGGGGGGMGRPRRGDLAAGPDSPPGAGPPGHDAAPQDSERIDAGGGFGGLVLPAGAYVVKGDQVPLGASSRRDDHRPGLAEPGAGARPDMDPVAAATRPTVTLRGRSVRSLGEQTVDTYELPGSLGDAIYAGEDREARSPSR